MFRNNANYNIQGNFRLLNNDESKSNLEYEIDIPYTYSPTFITEEDLIMQRANKNCDLLYPPPAADIPPQTSPPPFIPSKAINDNTTGRIISIVNTESLQNIQNKYSYIWQKNDKSYWAVITDNTDAMISGWKYKDSKWVYFGTSINNIDSYISY